MARRSGTGKAIADAISGKVWNNALDAAWDLHTSKVQVYGAISRNHGLFTDIQTQTDYILYYTTPNGKRLTPAEAMDVNTPITEVINNLSENNTTNCNTVYYNSNKELAQKMRTLEDATHKLVNIMSILYRGEEIEDEDAEN